MSKDDVKFLKIQVLTGLLVFFLSVFSFYEWVM